MTDIEMLLESDVTFTDFSEEEDVVKVKGFLCHEGIMNRQTFTKEKIDKAAPSFVGVPITTAHSSGIDVVIGGVDYTEGKPDESKDGLYGMYFEGRIGSEYSNIVNNIKRGFLNKLSMRIGPESSPSHFCNICGEPIGKCKHDFETPNFNPIVNDFYGKHVAIAEYALIRLLLVAKVINTFLYFANTEAIFWALWLFMPPTTATTSLRRQSDFDNTSRFSLLSS